MKNKKGGGNLIKPDVLGKHPTPRLLQTADDAASLATQPSRRERFEIEMPLADEEGTRLAEAASLGERALERRIPFPFHSSQCGWLYLCVSVIVYASSFGGLAKHPSIRQIP